MQKKSLNHFSDFTEIERSVIYHFLYFVEFFRNSHFPSMFELASFHLRGLAS